MHSAISHLTSEEVSELISLYYEQREKVANIIKKYELDITPSRFVTILPNIVHTETLCDYCLDVHMETKRQSRDAYAWSKKSPTCPVCGHTNSIYCSCETCKEIERQIEIDTQKLMRQAVLSFYNNELLEVPRVDGMSLRTAVLLTALERHSLSDDLVDASPFRTTQAPFSPSFNCTLECVKHLNSLGLIEQSPESTLDAFEFSGDLSHVTAYRPTMVDWLFLPGIHPSQKANLIAELTSIAGKQESWPESWQSERLNLWREIAKQECFENYEHLLTQRGFDTPKIGDKTNSTFETLLMSFSTAQIFNITWQAVRDTTDYMVRNDVPRYRIQNTFIGNILRKAEKARAEGWEIRNSRRDFDCPQSVLSSTYYDLYLGLGEVAFNHFPTE